MTIKPKLTHGQKVALLRLKEKHDRWQHINQFSARYLGKSTAAHLRKLEQHGFVKIDRQSGNKFYYSLTNADLEFLI